MLDTKSYNGAKNFKDWCCKNKTELFLLGLMGNELEKYSRWADFV